MPNFVDESLPKETMESMEQLRRNEELCDVDLVVDQQCFRAHRVVLAASSMYFRAMFCRQMAESGQRRVVIQGVDANALASLIKFAYTCSLEINEENAQSLLAASNFLQMLRAREACCKFLQERLDCSNSLDVADFAEFQSCQELLEAALAFARRNFTEISKNDRFCQISYARMKHFLNSNDLHLPEGEEAVFLALTQWTKANPSERQTHFSELLNLVKLPLVGQEFFAVEVAANPLVSQNELCMRLIREAARALYNNSYPDGMSHLCRQPTQIPMKWWPRETLKAGEVIHILGEYRREMVFTCICIATFSTAGFSQHPGLFQYWKPARSKYNSSTCRWGFPSNRSGSTTINTFCTMTFLYWETPRNAISMQVFGTGEGVWNAWMLKHGWYIAGD